MSREVSKVLEDLRLVIAQAQVDAASIGVIQQIDLEFVVEVQKKVGVSNPAIWLIPEALLDLGSDQIQTTTMKFQLTRKIPAADKRSLAALQAAIRTISQALQSLSSINDFVVSEIELSFDMQVSVEGEIKFFLRAGGARTSGHCLRLKFVPHKV